MGNRSWLKAPLQRPSQEAKSVDETNLDTQLYLLVATNQEIDDAKIPAALDPVIKQLRSSLPFKNYKLMTTLVNRVKNEGRLKLEVDWRAIAGIGGSFSKHTQLQ